MNRKSSGPKHRLTSNLRRVAQITSAALLAHASAVCFAIPIKVIPGPSYSSLGSGGMRGQFVSSTESTVGQFAVGGGGLAIPSSSLQTIRPFRWNLADESTSLPGILDLRPADQAASYSFAFAMNENGDIAGMSERYLADGTYKGNLPVVWPSNTVAPVPLNLLSTKPDGSSNSEAHAINSNRTSAGYGLLYSPTGINLGARAVRWDTLQAVPTLLQDNGVGADGTGYSEAIAINDAGWVVGSGSTFDSHGEANGNAAFAWAPGTTSRVTLPALPPSLPMPPGTEYNSLALDVNNQSVAVGTTRYSIPQAGVFGKSYAMRWNLTSGSIEPLFGPSGDQGREESRAVAINDAGMVTGNSTLYVSGVARGSLALVWKPGSNEPIALEKPPVSAAGYYSSIASGINAAGAVAGQVQLRSESGLLQNTRAALWLADNTFIDLDALIRADNRWRGQSIAQGISDTGLVTGVADYLGSGENFSYRRAFLLLVPEAGTYGRGDANFDTLVNFDDLLILAQHYGESNASQNIHVGDLNLDGSVNFDDLLALAQHYEESAASVVDADQFGVSFAADWAMARTLVPEPAGLATLAAIFGLRRRH